MKAVVMRNKSLVCDEVDEPRPGPGQALLKSLACGICGSDLHALHHMEHLVELQRRAGVVDGTDPTKDVIFGHEFCGELLEYGPDTQGAIKPGARVVAMPLAVGPGGLETIGVSNRFPGGFGERLVAMAGLLLEVPNGLSSDQAAMTEPMAVGIHGVGLAQIEGDSVCMVIGCGPIGLSVIAALKARGCAPIIAVDYSKTRRIYAERIGADIVIDPKIESPHQQWAKFNVPATLAEYGMAKLGGTAMRKAVVFECVGVPGILQSLLESLPPEAQIVVLGACMESDRIEPVLGVSKQLTIRFAYAYTPEEFALSLHRIAEGITDVKPLITETVGREGVASAFDKLGNPEQSVKIIVEPDRA